MNDIRFQYYVEQIPQEIECLLVGDIGGTNSNFGVFHQQDREAVFLFSLHIKSKMIVHFTQAVVEILKYIKDHYSITIRTACFAAAGVSSSDRMYCKPTNVSFTIDIADILQKTDISDAFVVNDFVVIGYGLNKIAPADLIQVRIGNLQKKATKAILGAGTGLGKAVLYWSNNKNHYISLPSEGGHADFVVHDELDFKFMMFIKNQEQRTRPISWEDVLSGEGIRRLYRFFKSQNNHTLGHLDNGPHPDEIFHQKDQDEYCHKTYNFYAKLYARCAKNFALETLALGGVYVAGGIAAHNKELFKEDIFLQEFLYHQKQYDLLCTIPLYVIGDYNVSLYGAAYYLLFDHL